MERKWFVVAWNKDTNTVDSLFGPFESKWAAKVALMESTLLEFTPDSGVQLQFSIITNQSHEQALLQRACR